MTATVLRYQLPKKAIKADCPQCGKRRTLSCYIDTRTGETLPEGYGRCDQESNCGYHLSPYHKTASGLSYADEVYEQWKSDTQVVSRTGYPDRSGFISVNRDKAVSNLLSADKPVYSIPDELFTQTLGRYEHNQFARLLIDYMGAGIANELLSRFQVGTSSRWPGACIFWYIDEHGRKRGGQIKLFGSDWHTEKYVDRQGKKRSKTDWVHTAFAYRCDQKQQPRPDWLTAYIDQHEFSPCLFGLPQLLTAPADQPVAIVEAPKTAILSTAYFPILTWMAVGALSYLNADRLAPVRSRKIILFPDLSTDGSAFGRWSRTADDLRQQGYNITVSDLLECKATQEEKQQGLDLADYLLSQWNGYPPDWDLVPT